MKVSTPCTNMVLWCFQLLDLQISLSPRVTLKPLVPSFPCFANVRVSLTEKVNENRSFSTLEYNVSVILCKKTHWLHLNFVSAICWPWIQAIWWRYHGNTRILSICSGLNYYLKFSLAALEFELFSKYDITYPCKHQMLRYLK